MNKVINTFLLTEDKLMPEMHCVCGPFTKNKERIQKF